MPSIAERRPARRRRGRRRLRWVGDLATNPVGLIIGSAGVVGAFTAIGFVIGRAMGRHAWDVHLFSGVVRNGGASVSVSFVADECDPAAQLLDKAARAVRDEPGPEAL
jgi:hypothetical protein